jgi:transposase-like protein
VYNDKGSEVETIVPQYSEAFRSRMVARMVGPRAVSANALSQEAGVSQGSLSRWLREVGSVEGMTQSSGKTRKGKKTWTGAEKLRVLTEAMGLSESDLGALLRREGLHETQLAEWRQAAEAALGETTRGRAPKPSGEAAREAMHVAMHAAAHIKELEREIRRKDKALAETAALLVLKKKVQEIWGNASEDEDDTTGRRRGK